MQRINWDFIIVGAGIAGLSLAESISRKARAKVLILELNRVGAGASTRNACRLTHAGCINPERAVHARDSHRALRDLEARLGENFLFQPLGEMTVLYHEGEIESFEKNVLPALRAAGLKGNLKDTKKIANVVPGFDFSGALAVFFSPESFVLHHDAALFALYKRLIRQGVMIKERAPVNQILYNREGSAEVVLDQGSFRARQVILCCGDASSDFLIQLGWNAPLQIVRQQTLVTEPVRKLNWPIVRWTGPDSAGSCHRTVRGEIIAACQRPRGDFSRNNGCTADFLMRTAFQLYHHIPVLKNVAIIRQWGGVTTNTADHMPYAGTIPGNEQIWVLFGMNAFTMYPLVAERMADCLLDIKEHASLASYALSPERGVLQV